VAIAAWASASTASAGATSTLRVTSARRAGQPGAAALRSSSV
jgi:hypothetical protein